MINENQVLQIAKRKPTPVVYKDFEALQPLHLEGYHYLRVVKKHLLNNGYICHEQKCKSKWDCDFDDWHTHFHRPGSGFKPAQRKLQP